MNEFDDVDPKDIEDLLQFMDKIEDQDVNYDLIMENLNLDLRILEEEMENYVHQIEVGFSKCHKDAKDPNYAYISDSGFDLYSSELCVIPPMGRGIVPTGIIIDIPENHEIQIRSKSGLALNQGLFVLNSPGTVDQGYTGGIKVILFNTNTEKIIITKGMKIAQAVLCPVVCGKWVKLVEKNELVQKDRNDNGFGSTGI